MARKRSTSRRSSPPSEDVFFNVRLPRPLHREVKKLAAANERSIAAEVRVAVRKHVDDEVQAQVA